MLAIGVAPGQGGELAQEVVEPLFHRGKPVIGLAKVVEPLGGLGGAARLVEHGAARLGLDLGNLPRGAGERTQSRIDLAGQRAGQKLEPVGHAAGLGLAPLE
jgi:hypothetical protein